MQFIKFTESNDWEGETWHFWLQVDGNELGLQVLKEKVLAYDPHGDTYSFGKTISENEVDVLVEHSDSGYMNTHNKVTGVMDRSTVAELSFGEDDDPLYKGGVESLFCKTV